MTTFKGRTAFHSGGGKTKFKGRSAFGDSMKSVDAAADIDDSNRRVAKSRMGAADGDDVSWRGRSGIDRGGKK